MTAEGIPIQFHFALGKTADLNGLNRIMEELNPKAKVYADSAYAAYNIEDSLREEKWLQLKIQRKGNSKRPDSKKETLEKSGMKRE